MYNDRMIAAMPSEKPQQPLDAMLNVRMRSTEVAELRELALELGVSHAVLARTALRMGLEPARQSIAESIEAAERGDPIA